MQSSAQRRRSRLAKRGYVSVAGAQGSPLALVLVVIYNKYLEQILDIPDTELFEIILKKKIPPANLKNSVLKKILRFCDGDNN